MGPRPRNDEISAGADADGSPRRRLWWAVGVLAAAVALAVVRPDLSLHAPYPDRGQGPLPAPRPTGSYLAVVAWDTRGDLTRDRGFVEAAVRRIRQQRPEVARVLFAGRLPDGSRLVLAGSDVNRGMVATAVHALLVAPGADVAVAPVTEVTTLTDPEEVLTWAGHGVDGHVYAVSLARPGPVLFELSPKVLFGADGAPHRLWSPATTGDGLAVVDLGRDADPAVAVRASGTGVFPIAQIARVASPPRQVRIAGVSAPSYAGPRPDLLLAGLRDATAALLDPADARIRVLWSGAPWAQRPLALLLVTRQDGQRLQVLVGEAAGSAFPAGVRALPSGVPDDVPWLLEPFSPQDPTFLLCPTGAGTLVYRRPGRPDQRLPVRASGAVVVVEPGASPPSARGADVTLLDPRGHELLRTTLPRSGVDDALALDQ